MDFDVIVIGGGHAGIEAAHASARIGRRTALITLDSSRIGVMSCNPAIGGLAKGQLVKEVDALGGVMARLTDLTAIQYRKLNASKGPAVQSSRAQCDKALYAAAAQRFMAEQPKLTILSVEATGIEVEGTRVTGIRCADGRKVAARSVVVTSGTFLRAKMYTGFETSEGGRVGDGSARGLSGSLESLGFKLGRLKTGTPPRLDRRSIDYSRLEPQPGDVNPSPFSFYFVPERFPFLPQVECHITYTNPRTHEIIEANFDRSPMFTGLIQGAGPRYCPSIEDKVKRFRDKERHQIFLEPEGLSTDEVYVNGISTSLPKDVQEEFVRSIDGLEKAEFLRHGYAVEYDCIDPRQLKATLESKDIQGLFFAGQVNGTSGYEEAAGQGIIAGINAARSASDLNSFTLSRYEGYIGVLIDDLTSKGADEPYRMFTSRAEYRLQLREDNADERLSESGHRLGLLDDAGFTRFTAKREEVARRREGLSREYLLPNQKTNEWLVARGERELKDRVSAEEFLRRPGVSWDSLMELGLALEPISSETVKDQIEIQVKYAGYIRRELDMLEEVRKSETLRIPPGLAFEEVPGLSNEAKGKLLAVRPETIGQASRLSGVTPAAIANLVIYLGMQKRRDREARNS